MCKIMEEDTKADLIAQVADVAVKAPVCARAVARHKGPAGVSISQCSRRPLKDLPLIRKPQSAIVNCYAQCPSTGFGDVRELHLQLFAATPVATDAIQADKLIVP